MFNDIVPKKVDDFIIHSDIAKKFKIYSHRSILNCIFYGPKNSGKKTLIDALISQIFNLESLVKKTQSYNIKINNNDVEIFCQQSNYHIEINLFEYGLYDKHVLCNFIKDIAMTKNVANDAYRFIVLHRLDLVNRVAQMALKRIMERTHKTARFIITTQNMSKINEALLSRSYLFRVGYEKKDIVKKYINNINEQYNLKRSKKYIEMILEKFNNNLFTVNSLMIYENKNYTDPVDFHMKELHKYAIKKHLNFIDNIRTVIYKMHLLDISYTDIIKSYLHFIIEKKCFTEQQVMQIIESAALNELMCVKSNKYFFCLERFFIFINSLS